MRGSEQPESLDPAPTLLKRSKMKEFLIRAGVGMAVAAVMLSLFACALWKAMKDGWKGGDE